MKVNYILKNITIVYNNNKKSIIIELKSILIEIALF